MGTPAVGDRLRCPECGTETVVVKAPAGAISCCGQPMVPRDSAGTTGHTEAGAG